MGLGLAVGGTVARAMWPAEVPFSFQWKQRSRLNVLEPFDAAWDVSKRQHGLWFCSTVSVGGKGGRG